MANKNSKRRAAQYQKQCRADKHFPTKGYKKKARPFPRVPWTNETTI